uniref:Gamma-glutamyltransferase 5a n=1 Tax=Neogobius melanostomus TaxID=47308 RepID=A0A8C6UJW4_9GOBI
MPTTRRSKPRVLLWCAVLVVVVIAIVVCAYALNRRCRGKFSKAAVAADSEKCSQIGRDMLQRGGSAVDGAIAALLCTSLINPQSMGLGGGASSLLSIFCSLEGHSTVINSRETVPKVFKVDLLQDCPESFRPLTGPEWIGVPGELRGYELAHRLYGKLPWATLFEPTIKLAREGLRIQAVLDFHIVLKDSNPLYLAYVKLFSDAEGKPLKAGDIVKFKKLADTLETIANEGAESFYSGQIAKDLISDIQLAGGTIMLEDLASYKATLSDAWTFPLDDFQVHIAPPPAGGAILAVVLNILKGLQKPTETYHLYIEAFKFANGLRKHIGDPNFISDKLAKMFIKDDFADYVRSLIGNRTQDDKSYNLTSYLDSMGTTHVSVLAEDGSAVSATSTINHMFGSQVFSPKTGIILNNELADFCGRTKIHPGEQPPSSASPTVLKSQSKTLVIGSSGGSMITTGMASALMNHLWFGEGLERAISSPVVFVNAQNLLRFEAKFNKDVIEGLKALGHKLEPKQGKLYNVVNAVEKDGECICARSDTRKKGKAAGY